MIVVGLGYSSLWAQTNKPAEVYFSSAVYKQAPGGLMVLCGQVNPLKAQAQGPAYTYTVWVQDSAGKISWADKAAFSPDYRAGSNPLRNQFVIQVPFLQSSARVVIQGGFGPGPHPTDTFAIAWNDWFVGKQVSGLEFLEAYFPAPKPSAFSRHGYTLVRNPTYLFTEDIDTLLFFTEVYDLDKLLGKGQRCGIRIRLLKYDSGDEVPGSLQTLALKAQALIPLFIRVPLREVPSGSYWVEIQTIDKTLKPVGRPFQEYFRRKAKSVAQPVIQADTPALALATFADTLPEKILLEQVDNLRMLATSTEFNTIESLMKNKELAAMRKFLYAFFKKRDALLPERPYQQYLDRCEEARRRYGMRRRPLHQTDRARVFVRYGPPNQNENEMAQGTGIGGPSYEIWTYYKMEEAGQTNVQFVFQADASSPGDYRLLHSNMKGERFNTDWRNQLNQQR